MRLQKLLNMSSGKSSKTNNDTLALLFFVVSIIYLCFFVGLILRTAVPMFSCKKYPNDRAMKLFRAFYGAIWIQTMINGILYWVMFGEAAGTKT